MNEQSDTKCPCGCCHAPDHGACKTFEMGGNGRCAYCDHGEGCHPGTGQCCNSPVHGPQPNKDPEKYLVLRRDGARPPWPWFVLGGRDPAAPAALRAYAEQAQALGMEKAYVQKVEDLADDFQRHMAQHGPGDPDIPSLVQDNPIILSQLGEKTPLLGPRVSSKFKHNVILVAVPETEPHVYSVPGATVIDGEGKRVFDGDLSIANMEGVLVRPLTAEELEELEREEASVEVHRNTIAAVAPLGGMARLTFQDATFVLVDGGYGLRQLVNVFEAEDITQLSGKEIAFWMDDHNILQGFLPWKEWVDAGGEEVPPRGSISTRIPG